MQKEIITRKILHIFFLKSFLQRILNNFCDIKVKSASIYKMACQKSISNFEGQYPTFSFNKSHEKYTNIRP